MTPAARYPRAAAKDPSCRDQRPGQPQRPSPDARHERGALPRAVVACPSTPTHGGFYIDGPQAAWETLIAAEFPGYLAAGYGPFTATAVTGASMGGYGALKLAFAAPGASRGSRRSLPSANAVTGI